MYIYIYILGTIAQNATDKTKVMCISFRLSNIGVVAIKSHEKTVKHAKNLNSFNLQPSVSQFFSKPASSPGSSVVESVTAAGLVQPKNFLALQKETTSL